MAYILPTFNITVEIFTGPWLARVLRVSGVPANLAVGKRVQQPGNDYVTFATAGFEFGITAFLLLPRGTDVRSQSNGANQDIVEVPSGSSCWYQVSAWEDMALGFSNEYRIASVAKIWQGLNPTDLAGCLWPVPTPARS